ncbi:MAG: nitrite/sulfite reductase [Planctomycetota bacterium]|jgi:sulfite reductase (ferredoxin)|nr:nitrite/sulfite reductase [Planctomycetota bacterium]
MSASWKNALGDAIPADIGEEIDVYERQCELRRDDNIDEKVFAEVRLRRGAYGQRYDNGHRNDGKQIRDLVFPTKATKGPGVEWDAPGMIRIKIPYGGVTARQLEVMADLAEEYCDAILHVTTRQDIQLHFLHIDDSPDLMRRLAAVGITTREACGNAVRNVTGCPFAGVCKTEAFDTTVATEALWKFLLGHKDAQDFGRKMKISFSGCASEACAMARMHDIGLVAKVQDGKRGFEYYVGGGLGAVPHQAPLLYEFLSEEELLPISQCICRIFGRMGEKKNRSKARIKFLVAKLGIEEFRKLIEEERKTLPHDDRWTDWIGKNEKEPEEALLAAAELNGQTRPDGFDIWFKTNVKPQRQPGFCTVELAMPLGDYTSAQSRALADIARTYVGETMGVRLTVEQNVVLRWIPGAKLIDLFQDLVKAKLASPSAQTIVDVTACPGTDTCKLGIAASRGLAGELRERLAAKQFELDEAVRGLKIKVSGCFNSCGQHHVADIGFYGVTRKRHGFSVPHFQMILGGQMDNNAHSYGLPQFAIPAKRIPEAIDRLTGWYAKEREQSEGFQDFIKRMGKPPLKDLLKDLTEIAPYEEDPTPYTDWHDPREYTTGDIGIGECAGELVETVDFGISEAERLAFEAQIALDAKDADKAAKLAMDAMFSAAKALVYTQNIDITNDRAAIVAEFTSRLVEPQIFWDQYVGAKYADYFRDAVAEPVPAGDLEAAHRRVEEATLFIEASHTCKNGMKVVEA